MCTFPNPHPNNDPSYVQALANHDSYVNLSPLLSLPCALIASLVMVSLYDSITRRRTT